MKVCTICSSFPKLPTSYLWLLFLCYITYYIFVLEFYLKYAHGIVSEYLEDYLIEKLEKKFNFKTELVEYLGNKRKSEVEDINETNKRVKHEPNDTEVDFKFNSITPEIKKPKTLTAKEKARHKAASGTKTISSFFTKK